MTPRRKTPAGRSPRAVPPGTPPAGPGTQAGEGTPDTPPGGRWSAVGPRQPLMVSGRVSVSPMAGTRPPGPPVPPVLAVCVGGTGYQQATRGSRVAVGPEAAGAWVAGDGTPVAASGRRRPPRPRGRWILPAPAVRWTRRLRRLAGWLLFAALAAAAGYVVGLLIGAVWLLYA